MLVHGLLAVTSSILLNGGIYFSKYEQIHLKGIPISKLLEELTKFVNQNRNKLIPKKEANRVEMKTQ